MTYNTNYAQFLSIMNIKGMLLGGMEPRNFKLEMDSLFIYPLREAQSNVIILQIQNVDKEYRHRIFTHLI